MFARSCVLILAVSATTPLARADTITGLVGHWPFDGNFHDVSGNGRHAIPHGAPTFVPGRAGAAASFDGIDDWLGVDHGGALTFDVDTQSYTIALLFFCRDISTTSDPCILQDRYGSNHSVSYNLAFNGNVTPQNFSSNTWYGESTGTVFQTITPAAPLVGAWHHVAVAFDHTSGLKKMYVDGALVGTAPRPNEPFAPGSGNTLTIAAYYAANLTITNFFRGQLDDLRIYNRALSPCDIASLARAAAPTSNALTAGFELDTVGAAPSGFYARLPGASQAVAASPSGGNALRLVAAPSSSADASSFETLNYDRGRATLSFKLLWSSQSTASPLACNDMGVSFQGSVGSFGIGFVAPAGDPNGPRVISGTCTPVQQDRWYEFVGVADMGSRTVDWYVDGMLASAATPMLPGVTDPSRRDHLELHVGCIDNGQSVAYFDSILFTAPRGCAADFNDSGITSVQDLFDFLARYFSPCP